MAGAVTAAALSAAGVRCTVYDTGKRSAGGRCATRDAAEQRGLSFDHGAQHFSLSPGSPVEPLLTKWLEAGVVRAWTGPVHSVSRSGSVPLAAGPPRYVATSGFRHLVEHVLKHEAPLATLRRPCWVDEMRSASVGMAGPAWTLLAGGRIVGEHDFVVVAHNGKCANRLLRPSGAPLVDAQMARMKLTALWCTLAAFSEPLDAPFEGAYVADHPALAWACNNNAKLGLQKGAEAWTLFSTASYGSKNKCPQENVPADVSARVTSEMLAALSDVLGRPLPPVAYSRTQLWGAALPSNSPKVPCIFDGDARVGMCGDWLLGSSIEAAASSGLAMAALLAGACAGRRGDADLSDLSCGLHARFTPLAGAHDIGTAEGGAGGGKAARVYASRGAVRSGM